MATGQDVGAVRAVNSRNRLLFAREVDQVKQRTLVRRNRFLHH